MCQPISVVITKNENYITWVKNNKKAMKEMDHIFEIVKVFEDSKYIDDYILKSQEKFYNKWFTIYTKETGKKIKNPIR